MTLQFSTQLNYLFWLSNSQSRNDRLIIILNSLDASRNLDTDHIFAGIVAQLPLDEHLHLGVLLLDGQRGRVLVGRGVLQRAIDARRARVRIL